MDIDVLFKRETVAVEAGNNWQDKPGPGPDWVGGHLPSAWCQQLHSTPSQSRCEDCEVVSCFKSYIITSWWCLSPKLFCEVVDEINLIKNTTGLYRVDELVSLHQLYTVGGPNLTSVSGTWQSLQHTNLIHSFLFLSQSLTRLLMKRTWKNEKLWLTFIALKKSQKP